MDEEEFRKTRAQYDASRCPFEKIILSGRHHCQHANKYSLGEREGVSCIDQHARGQCNDFLAYTLEQSRFALGLSHGDAPLPHGKAMRLQQGSLHALHEELNPQDSLEDLDIHSLLSQALTEYGSLQALPFQAIVRDITHAPIRKKGS